MRQVLCWCCAVMVLGQTSSGDFYSSEAQCFWRNIPEVSQDTSNQTYAGGQIGKQNNREVISRWVISEGGGLEAREVDLVNQNMKFIYISTLS